MSAVTSNANLGDFNVYDTFVESAEAALGPSEFDNLLFALNCSPQSVVTLAGTNYALTVADYMQAVNSYLTIVCTSAADLTVGADTVANAQTLVSLFGLSSANRYRVLTFLSANASNLTSASAGAVSIKNTSSGPATTAYVNMMVTNSDTPAATAAVYATDAADNGVFRRVQVYFATMTAGAEVVSFRVLPS